MAQVVPTVTAYTTDDLQQQFALITSTAATRLHLDVTDDVFASPRTVQPDQLWAPEGFYIDIHLMYQMITPVVHDVLLLAPDMVTVHAEAADVHDAITAFHAAGVKVCLALLQQTSVKEVEPLVEFCDGILIFSGSLGRFGGAADLLLLEKVMSLRRLKPTLEIGWDGGINETNARQLVVSGVDILNVGGAIHHADDPKLAYAELSRLTHA
ncbi:MAG TPA: hypothetical protein VF597_02455 [Candidatus Saccharimonadales bacterium]|jgi:pentose-5-phosphate-3-epimerase